MQRYVTITLDGVRIRALPGVPVLETALTYGICIPHLCHIPNMVGFGACRLCIVEVVKNGRAKVTTSCTLEPQEGLVVVTNSEKILRLRRNVAEMLVAEAPNSKAIQDIAVRCGVTNVRYPFRNKDCVLCGRCVQVCGQSWHTKALGFIGRGKERQVGFPFGERPVTCNMCMNCSVTCPMTTMPCGGLMPPGQERLCGECESQVSSSHYLPGECTRCELGKGFGCIRSAW